MEECIEELVREKGVCGNCGLFNGHWCPHDNRSTEIHIGVEEDETGPYSTIVFCEMRIPTEEELIEGLKKYISSGNFGEAELRLDDISKIVEEYHPDCRTVVTRLYHALADGNKTEAMRYADELERELIPGYGTNRSTGETVAP